MEESAHFWKEIKIRIAYCGVSTYVGTKLSFKITICMTEKSSRRMAAKFNILPIQIGLMTIISKEI